MQVEYSARGAHDEVACMNKNIQHRFSAVRRLMCLFFALVLTAGLLPADYAEAAGQYGRVNHDEVRFRKQADSTEYWAMLNTGWVVEILSSKRSGGVDYYYVKANIPNHLDRDYWGYISQQYLTQMTEADVLAWQNAGGNSTSTSTAAASTVTSAVPAVTYAGETSQVRPTGSSIYYFRYDPATNGLVYAGVLDYNQSYTVLSSAMVGNAMYDVISLNGGQYYVNMDDMMALAAPAATAAVGTSYTAQTAGTYVQPTSSSVNYYSYNGVSLSSLGLLNAGSAYFLSGTSNIGGETYYIIAVGTANCYVKASNMTAVAAQQPAAAVTAAPSASYTNITPAGTGTTAASGSSSSLTAIGMVRIKPAGTTNMRSAAHMLSGNIVATVKQGTELPYFYTVTPPSGNHLWYYCYDAASGRYGFIVDDCVTVLYNATVAPIGTVTQVPVVNVPTAEPGASNSTVAGYIRIVPKGKTNIRKTTRVDTKNVAAQVEQNTILPYYAMSVVNQATWYYVYDAQAGVFGYVLGSCAERINSSYADVTAPTTAPSFVTAVPSSTAAQGYIRFTAGGVNLRKEATTAAKVLDRFDKNQITPYYGTVLSNGRTWYLVRTDTEQGYVMGDFVEVVNNTGTVVTAIPGVATAAPAPSAVQGYVMTTANKVYVRKAAGTNAGIYGQVANAGTVLPIVGPSVTNNAVVWYSVEFEGHYGYIHGRYVTVLNADQSTAYQNGQPMPTATPTPTPAPKPVDYIQTTTDKVWIRKSPSTAASTKGQAALGAVFHFTGTTTAGGAQWYRIEYMGGTCYIMAKYCRVMTDAEYAAYQGTTLPGTVTATPDPANMSNIAVTNMEKVIVRASGASNGKQIALLYKANQVCTLLGGTNVSGGYTWYNVSVNGVSGWIRGDLLRILTTSEAQFYNQTGTTTTQPTASYTALQLGSTGTAVLNLQTRLAQMGYLTSTNVTGIYDTMTQTAVRNYQQNNGLTPDGVATPTVQHMLFGTVEPGTATVPGNNGSSVNGVVLYRPELIDWNTGGIQDIFYKGCVAIVTDVKTGISFQVKRWSGGDHADVEPLTAADTAAMCRIYGVSKAQDINDKNLYQRHPVLVTIGTRSFAASMYGVPHNYPDGDTIPNNNFNGQFCLHFVNSRIHKSNKVDADHQKAIMYAYENAATLLGIR